MRLKSKKSKKNRNKKNISRRKGPMFWMTMGAMGALTACGAFNSNPAGFAYAQSPRSSFPAIYFRSQAQAATYRFDIPPGPLDTALSSFEQVTGWKVVLSKDEIGSIPSPGVSGVYTIEQGLKQLLTGTGVSYRFTGPETLTLEVSGPSTSINVTGPAATISSSKYTEPLRDVPQTVAVIPKAVIEEQGATTLRDVLRNVPGLTIAAGEGGTPAGDNLTLRGFSARNDVFVDGVRDLSPQARDPFNLEQVEVVKGPASAYNGRGSTGGTINLVSKAPTVAPVYGFTLNLGSDETRRVTADVNLPLERLGLGKRTAFRFNFLAHESGVAGRDVVENQRWGAAPSLAFGLGTPTRSDTKLFQTEARQHFRLWNPLGSGYK